MARLRHRPRKNSWPLHLVTKPISRWLPKFGNRRRMQKLRLGEIASGQKNSRLQRRLRRYARSNHIFFSLLQRRQNQPSRLHRRVQAHTSQRLWQRGAVVAVLGLTIIGAIWTNLFVAGRVTFGGVPYSIVNKFWKDKEARTAYFTGDRQELHTRLKALGIEADIKDYYRDRFSNEYELDKYIHQIMFDRTGYVGEAYRVNDYGELISIEY